MRPYYERGGITLYHGDALDVLSTLNPVDAVVTDPPYGLAFMGKRWDYDVPSIELWQACLDALKPGGHLLAFAGTRTQHRMAVRIEDAGFEIRDLIAWVYSQGFPKSLDVSKAIDRAAGAEREVGQPGPYAARRPRATVKAVNAYQDGVGTAASALITSPATDAAREWQGWATALKPALEPITVARKPLIGTVADNVLAHGTGALNVDGCRVEAGDGYTDNAVTQGINTARTSYEHRRERRTFEPSFYGRWPANLIHDGSDEVVTLFPKSKSTGGQASLGAFRKGAIYGKGREQIEQRDPGYGDDGSAARFFYCAKAPRSERGAGNDHPTVKPLALMRYLCRLVTPPNGLLLDPFAGSGTTLLAARREGKRAIGIEVEERYCEIAARRLEQDTLPLEALT